MISHLRSPRSQSPTLETKLDGSDSDTGSKKIDKDPIRGGRVLYTIHEACMRFRRAQVAVESLVTIVTYITSSLVRHNPG